MEAHDWITLGGLMLTMAGLIVAAVRYVDKQIAALHKVLYDKLSIGEYSRRHEAMDRRIRSLERRADYRNGMDRIHTQEGEDFG